MPLVIYSLGVGHTDTSTHLHEGDFKKPGVPGSMAGMFDCLLSGLIRYHVTCKYGCVKLFVWV